MGQGSFFKVSYSQIILGWILMILQELSSLGGGLRSLSSLVLTVTKLFTQRAVFTSSECKC